MKTRYWITGATGFVGGHFLRWVLEHGDAEVVALVRRRAEVSALSRLLDGLEEVAASYREPFDRAAASSRICVVHGDITEAGCGVLEAELPAPLPFVREELWHIAASLSFEERYRARIRLHNVDGTRHALALAERIGAARFVHVSTAYVCGRMSGQVPEALHTLDRPFNNVYEQTKCEAEHEVVAWAERSGRAVAIVRPSIVVGPRATHLPGGSDTGLYGFARELERLGPMLRAAKRSLTMCGHPEAPVNLVPVDDVAREMWRLSNTGFSGGLVHHITSQTSPTVAQVLAVVGEQCGIGPVHSAARRSSGPSPVEQVIDRRARFYGSYLVDDKRFARRAGAALHVTERDLTHYVRQYVKARRGEHMDAVFRRVQLRGADGQQLVSHVAGAPESPCLVLCNAYGVPPDVWVPLASALAPDFRLVTWELRQAGADAGPEAHVADMARVMGEHGVAEAHLVGWCTGADIALSFAERYPERVAGVVSIGGALNAMAADESAFQRNMRRMVDKAAQHHDYAALCHDVLFGGGDASRAGERAMFSSMLGALDPGLLHLTSAPFRDPASLHRYARSMRAHYRHARAGAPKPAAHALFVVGAQDEVAHPGASRAAAARLPRARLVELPDADHFALYTDSRVAFVVRDFVRSTSPARELERASA